jgi:hypothetical protein
MNGSSALSRRRFRTNGVDLVQVVCYGAARKNAVDVRMAVDGMETLITHREVSVLVAEDGDHTPLVQRCPGSEPEALSCRDSPSWAGTASARCSPCRALQCGGMGRDGQRHVVQAALSREDHHGVPLSPQQFRTERIGQVVEVAGVSLVRPKRLPRNSRRDGNTSSRGPGVIAIAQRDPG